MYTQKTKHCWNKDLNKWKRKTFYAHGLEDSKLLRWLYSPNWSTDSMQSYENLIYLSFFCRDWEVDLKIYIKYSLYSYKEYIKNSCNSTMKRQIIQFYNGQSFWTDISLLNLFCVGFWLCCAAWGILVPWQGSNPCPLQWMCKALTTGPSGKSLNRHLSKDNI